MRRDHHGERARTFRFDELPRAVRERFVAAANGQFPPRPVLHVGFHTPTRASWIWALLAALGALAILAVHFGELGHARQPHAVAVPLAALTLVACIAALRGRKPRKQEYRDGWYVFPSTVVHAERGTLTSWPRSRLSLRSEGSRVVGRLGRLEHFELDGFDEAGARAIVASLVSQVLPSASGVFDAIGDAALYDPLAPIHDVDGVRVAPASLPPPPFGLRPSVGALVAAVALAVSVHELRDRLSDELAFARARAVDSPAAYASYLRDGKLHRDEVERTLLPRLELREALASGSLVAIERFRASRPGSFTDELARARRGILFADLGGQSASLAGLAQFEARHVRDGLGPEIALARRALYDGAARRLVGDARTPPVAGAPIAGRLLSLARDEGPRIDLQLVIDPIAPGALLDGDRTVLGTPRFGGNSFLPSHLPAFVTAAVAAPSLGTLRATLGDALGDLVAIGVLGDVSSPRVTALELRVHADLDGGLVVDPGAPTLAALRFGFEWSLVKPAGTRELLGSTMVRVRRTCLTKDEAATAFGAYSAMTRLAFAEAVRRMLDPIAAPPRECEC
jgi:hypothetical protein